jgi:hypothetical protein
MPMAVAYARLGRHDRAIELADQSIDTFRQLGSEGLNLVLGYETRSRVALYARDLDGYQRFASLCADASRGMSGQALRAKYERLMLSASAGVLEPPENQQQGPFGTSVVESAIEFTFRDCDGTSKRAERALELLISQSGATGGVLYLSGDHGLVRAAQSPSIENEIDLLPSILEFVETELEGQSADTISLERPASSLAQRPGQFVFVLLSHQIVDGVGVTGVAALATRLGAPFAHPGELAAQLSRTLTNLGDVAPLTMMPVETTTATTTTTTTTQAN